ncbi:MAG: hypothetical protein JWN95_2751 [Frankiales bacterium]|nr:hypothetical protein [Frankiales bacterium]
MRQLRLVGPGDDGMLVLESDDGAEQFMLPVSPALRIASAEPEPVRATTAGPNEPEGIRPRDIQIRVRAGEDPQAIADESGTSLERIMRFAYPVLQERIRVVDEARRSRARGTGGTHVLFGELAETGFAAHGIDVSKIEWNALRRPDGGWSVLASVPGPRLDDDTPVVAKFSLVLTSRTVSALNDVAADLLSGHPIRALQPPPVYGPITVNDTASAAAGTATSTAEFGTRLAAVPTIVPADEDLGDDPETSRIAQSKEALSSEITVSSDGTVSSEGTTSSRNTLSSDGTVAPDSTGSAPASRRQMRRLKARTHPVPINVDEDEPFDREAFAPKGFPESGWHEQALPLDLPLAVEADSAHPAIDPSSSAGDPATDAAGPADDPRPRRTGRANDKPRMPSWDDILLGVRRKSE